MSKYKLLRDSIQELKREASEKGGSNPRAQMILDLIADCEVMQAQVAQLEIALEVVKTVLESDDPAIADTIWVPDHVSLSETLYDYICSALSAYHKQGNLAMSEQYYVVPHPKLKRDYKGRIVRTTRELKNGWGVIPVGAVATISNQSPKGLSLTLNACGCCGLKAIISHVSANSFEFIEPIAQQRGGV